MKINKVLPSAMLLAVKTAGLVDNLSSQDRTRTRRDPQIPSQRLAIGKIITSNNSKQQQRQAKAMVVALQGRLGQAQDMRIMEAVRHRMRSGTTS